MKNKIQLFVLGIGLILFFFVGVQMVSAEATGYALKFDGTDDIIIIPNDESLNFGCDDFSVELWLKPNPILCGGGKLLTKGGQYNIEYEFDNTDFYIGFFSEIYDPYICYAWAGNDEALVGLDNVWHLLSMVRSGDDLKVFINGVSEFPLYSDPFTEPNCDTSNDLDLFIGGEYSFEILYAGYGGLMDNVRIYNRALSDVELTEHSAGIYTDETGLVGYWNFNVGSGDIAFDSSGLGNDGIIYGGAVYEFISELEPEPEPVGIITAGFEGNMPENSIASTTAFIGDLFSSTGVLIYLFIGIPFAFFIIFEIVGMIKDRKIWAKK